MYFYVNNNVHTLTRFGSGVSQDGCIGVVFRLGVSRSRSGRWEGVAILWKK